MGLINSFPRQRRQPACITVNTEGDRKQKQTRKAAACGTTATTRQQTHSAVSTNNMTSRWGLSCPQWCGEPRGGQLVVASCHVGLGVGTGGVGQRVIDAAVWCWLVELVLAHPLTVQLLATNSNKWFLRYTSRQTHMLVIMFHTPPRGKVKTLKIVEKVNYSTL